MPSYLTEEGFQQLRHKIAELKDTLRKTHGQRAESYSRDGDGTHDNPAFHALDLELRAQEKKLDELTELLLTAQVIPDGPRNTEAVRIRSIVKVRREHNTESQDKIFEIVGIGETDLDRNRIAYNSPIGQALLGLRPGETTEVELPDRTIAVFRICQLYRDWSDTSS
jgi:transcription elongation factor GreA